MAGGRGRKKTNQVLPAANIESTPAAAPSIDQPKGITQNLAKSASADAPSKTTKPSKPTNAPKPAGTRTSNQSKHPGMAVIDSSQKWRPLDERLAEKAAIEARRKAKATALNDTEEAVARKIAELEDRRSQRDAEKRQHSVRPDQSRLEIKFDGGPKGAEQHKEIEKTRTAKPQSTPRSSSLNEDSNEEEEDDFPAPPRFKSNSGSSDSADGDEDDGDEAGYDGSAMDTSADPESGGELPEESAYETESASEQHGLSTDPESIEEMYDDGDREEDEDYKEERDDERSVEEAPTSKGKERKKKKGRGELRAAALQYREVSPERGVKPSVSQTSGKRKERDGGTDQPTGRSGHKKSKKGPIGGLLADFKKKIETAEERGASRASSGTSGLSKPTSEDESGGVFAADESDSLITSDRAAKSSVVIRNVRDVDAPKGARARQTTETNIKVKVKDEPAVPSRVNRDHLPFQEFPPSKDCVSVYKRRWKKQFVPALYLWAATCEDPFRVMSQSDVLEKIMDIWMVVFPELTGLTDRHKLLIQRICGNELYTWRSEIGKKAVKVFDKEMGSDPDIDVVKKFVQNALLGQRFLYKDADGAEGEKGAFQSDLVLAIFALYLKQVAGATHGGFGYPVGALALCTAAMERAIDSWSKGIHPSRRNENDKPKGFIEKPWGQRAVAYARSLKQNMTDELWQQVLSAGAALAIPSDNEGDDDGSEVVAEDPRSNISF